MRVRWAVTRHEFEEKIMEAYILNSETMGSGDENLGKVLMGAFLKKLWAKVEKPDILILYNAGVKLLDKESGYMDVLVGLEEAGVEILACGTCLDHYDLRSTMVAGHVSNMEDIVATMSKAEKVVTI